MIKSTPFKRTLLLIVALISLSLGLLLYQTYQPARSQDNINSLLRDQGIFIRQPARIIAPFQLQNQQGEAITESAFHHRWSLVFFGFTHCPDVCPTTLTLLKKTTRLLAPTLQTSTAIVLVTVDPARDTAATLNKYINHFGGDITGITGDFLDIHSLASSLDVPFHKVTFDDGHYMMDHSGYVYLINPQGQYQAFFKPPFDAQTLAARYTTVRSHFSGKDINP